MKGSGVRWQPGEATREEIQVRGEEGLDAGAVGGCVVRHMR